MTDQSDLARLTWSPPGSPLAANFYNSQSQIYRNYSSDDGSLPCSCWKSPRRGFSTDPFASICYGTLYRLEFLTEIHDPSKFIKLTAVEFLFTFKGVLSKIPRMCLLHLTLIQIEYPHDNLIKGLPLQDFPCLRELRIGGNGMPCSRVEFVDPHIAEQSESKQTRKAFRYAPDPEKLANGIIEMITSLQYHVETMAGAADTLGQSHAAASTVITIVETQNGREKSREAARIPSACDSTLKRICRHHGILHCPTIKTNKDNHESKTELQARNLSGKTVAAEAEAEAFSQSFLTTSPGAVDSIMGSASFSSVALETANVNQYNESRSKPSASFESPLASTASSQGMLNYLLFRLRRISWSLGASCTVATGVHSNLELMRLPQDNNLWHDYVAFKLRACSPQNSENSLILEFTFLLYSQMEFLMFQASIMQQNIPPEMTDMLIVGAKELKILDDLLEAILAVQPMLVNARNRQIKDEDVKAWLKKVIHIFYETLGVLTDCRRQIKKLHIERIEDCSRFHMKGLPCWINSKSESIARMFDVILMLSKHLIELHNFFRNFSHGHLVEPHDLRAPEVVGEMMMPMIPDSLGQSLVDDWDAITRRDVGSLDESVGHVGKLYNDLTLQSMQTPELEMEMRALEQPLMEECDAITRRDVGSSDESLGNVFMPHDDLTLWFIQTPELATEMGAPDSLEQLSKEECDAVDVASSDQSLGHVVKLHDDLTLQSMRTPELVTEMRARDSLEHPTMEAIGKVGDVASSSQSLAAIIVVDKQSKRKISFKKRGRTKKSFSLEVLLQHSSKTLKEAASSLRVGKSTIKRTCRAMGISHWSELKDINLAAKDGAFSQTLLTTRPLPSAAGSIFEPANLNGCSSNQQISPVALQPTELIQEFIGSRHHRYCSYPPHDRLETTTTTVVHTTPPETTKMQEDVRPVIVKATYKGDTTKFKLFSTSKKVDLEEKLAQKLKLKIGSFKIKYEDEDKDKILVSTDSDLEDYIRTSESLGNTTIRLLVEPTTK